MMRNGIAYQRPSLARPISEIARGFLPTPTKGGGGQTLPPGTTPTGITPAGQKRTVSLEQYLAQARNGIWPIPMLPTITVNDAGNITAQIGSASWRERVCKYVQISVVGVSIKQNKNK